MEEEEEEPHTNSRANSKATAGSSKASRIVIAGVEILLPTAADVRSAGGSPRSSSPRGVIEEENAATRGEDEALAAQGQDGFADLEPVELAGDPVVVPLLLDHDDAPPPPHDDDPPPHDDTKNNTHDPPPHDDTKNNTSTSPRPNDDDDESPARLFPEIPPRPPTPPDPDNPETSNPLRRKRTLRTFRYHLKVAVAVEAVLSHIYRRGLENAREESGRIASFLVENVFAKSVVRPRRGEIFFRFFEEWVRQELEREARDVVCSPLFITVVVCSSSPLFITPYL